MTKTVTHTCDKCGDNIEEHDGRIVEVNKTYVSLNTVIDGWRETLHFCGDCWEEIEVYNLL